MIKNKKLLLLLIPICFVLGILISKNIDKPKTTFKDNYDVFEDVDDGAAVLKEKDALNPYTGELLTDEQSVSKPFMCMIENSRQARNQSGLSQADIVYETMAEGGISRFMCLFYSKNVDKIGPVRSLRPYFLNIASEYGVPFAHCGGSAEAMETVSQNSQIPSINEMTNSSYFWRDNSRVAPHNLYTSSERINNHLKESPKGDTPDTNLTFDDDYWENDTFKNCQDLDLDLSHYYQTSYKFTQDGYTKYMDGTECVDDSNNESLVFKNIILQLTDMSNTDTSYIDIRQTGSGSGYVISNGKVQKMTWSKASKSSPTIIKDSNNKVIPLSTGNTIWHIVDKNNKITIS